MRLLTKKHLKKGTLFRFPRAVLLVSTRFKEEEHYWTTLLYGSQDMRGVSEAVRCGRVDVTDLDKYLSPILAALFSPCSTWTPKKDNPPGIKLPSSFITSCPVKGSTPLCEMLNAYFQFHDTPVVGLPRASPVAVTESDKLSDNSDGEMTLCLDLLTCWGLGETIPLYSRLRGLMTANDGTPVPFIKSAPGRYIPLLGFRVSPHGSVDHVESRQDRLKAAFACFTWQNEWCRQFAERTGQSARLIPSIVCVSVCSIENQRGETAGVAGYADAFAPPATISGVKPRGLSVQSRELGDVAGPHDLALLCCSLVEPAVLHLVDAIGGGGGELLFNAATPLPIPGFSHWDYRTDGQRECLSQSQELFVGAVSSRIRPRPSRSVSVPQTKWTRVVGLRCINAVDFVCEAGTWHGTVGNDYVAKVFRGDACEGHVFDYNLRRRVLEPGLGTCITGDGAILPWVWIPQYQTLITPFAPIAPPTSAHALPLVNAVISLHGKDIVHGDLHIGLYLPGPSVRLCDLDCAFDSREQDHGGFDLKAQGVFPRSVIFSEYEDLSREFVTKDLDILCCLEIVLYLIPESDAACLCEYLFGTPDTLSVRDQFVEYGTLDNLPGRYSASELLTASRDWLTRQYYVATD
ncbi:hypothetical protein KIPB_002545 [Kipferlia bialata]|uniref:Protein kinase domain-containing protein n=1 Tax=Kipferlia bialata TaxID=797122 RepID=A0A391NUW8_9EUKA|nr:hypothetical protein KIPB_002545 [Kipferlia bialata]|eukprot:g2545.t1